MTMITPSYLGETIEYSSLHACRSTLEDPTVDPTIDVVGPFDVSPGLMLIDMDYGWLRASDVLTQADEQKRQAAREATDALVIARARVWHLEEEVWARGQATRRDVTRILDAKRAVRQAVERRDALGTPGIQGAEGWWQAYEVHNGPMPAGMPPQPLLFEDDRESLGEGEGEGEGESLGEGESR